MADSPADKMMEMLFPLNGVNVATAFDQQPVQSTPVGVNVRCQEPLGLRLRGGSRPGISKFISAQVNGSHLIQCLDTVTWTSPLALLDPPVDPATGVTDPSNLGRGGELVRKGGSGHQLGGGRSKSKKIQFVQKASVSVNDGSDLVATFPSPVGKDNLIVVVTNFFIGSIGVVSDGLGNSYQDAIQFGNVDISYATVDFPGSCSVTSTNPSTDTGSLVVLEYKNTKVVGPSDGTNSNAPNDPTAMTTNSVPVNNTGDLLIGAFSTSTSASDPVATLAAGAGFTQRANLVVQAPGPGPNIYTLVEELIGVDVAQAAIASGSGFSSPATTGYIALGASFKKA